MKDYENWIGLLVAMTNLATALVTLNTVNQNKKNSKNRVRKKK